MKNLYLIISLVVLSACTSIHQERFDENTVIHTFYASINTVTRVEYDSQAGDGAMLGAGIGFLENVDGNSSDMLAGAFIGAFIGGLFTSLVEGDNTVYRYELYSIEQGDFAIIQEDKLEAGVSCVKVYLSRNAKMFPAPSNMCE